MSYFERVSPESVGIESRGILTFLEEVHAKGIEQHSIMVIRHGKCCAAAWWKPYAPEILHPLYSFSKSLTATAIGFAEQEGILSLDERLADIFPDKAPKERPAWLMQMNLRHLLTMSCGHETEITDVGPDWERSFLAHPVLHEPGSLYKYNTAGTNMLAAVLKRRTGQNVTEFLRPRLLEPLGIHRITCFRLPGEDAVEHGGGGMALSTEDMAKFTYFLLRRGNWEGRQLLAEDWFDRACSKQIETAGDSEGHVGEWANGYGYQCWMGSLPGSFRADGAYGQFGFVYPSLDLIVVMTTATEQTQSLVDSMMEWLIPAVKDETLPAAAESRLLTEYLRRAELAPCAGDRCPVMENRLCGQTYLTLAASRKDGCSSLERLVGGAGLRLIREGEITRMSFACMENRLIWKVWENGQTAVITASLNRNWELSSFEGNVYAASARWRSFGVLEMEIRRLDTLSGARLIFRFSDTGLTLVADETLVSAGGLGLCPKKTAPFRIERQ